MNPATAIQQPVQTYQVATRMLSTPGLRITNKERKNLKRVRQQASALTVPILGDKKRGYRLNDNPPEPYTVAKRLTAKTFKQLRNLAKRLPIARRRLVRLRFKASKIDIREALTKRIEYIESIAPLVEVEFTRRGSAVAIAL